MGSDFKGRSLRKGDWLGTPVSVPGSSLGTEEKFAQLPDDPFGQKIRDPIRDPNDLLSQPHSQGAGDGSFSG